MVCSLYHPLKRSWVFYPTSTLKYLFIYLGWAGSLLPHKPSLVSSEGYSLVAVHRLLFAVSSLVAEHGLGSTGSVVVVPGLCCSMACGNFLDQGSNPSPLNCQADSYPLDHQGSPFLFYFFYFLFLFFYYFTFLFLILVSIWIRWELCATCNGDKTWL